MFKTENTVMAMTDLTGLGVGVCVSWELNWIACYCWCYYINVNL